jgi:hypothetical protein
MKSCKTLNTFLLTVFAAISFSVALIPPAHSSPKSSISIARTIHSGSNSADNGQETHG